MKNILLIEPDYPNKYPPLGLLKIGTYHKLKGDKVLFYKGCIKVNNIAWDRIYITTLFSFYHDKTIDTILHYKSLLKGNIKKLFIGGIYASLEPNVIYNATGIYPHVGLLDKPGILGDDDIIVDTLIPDYELISGSEYDYSLLDSYFGYATRGCPNNCKFCAVRKLEPCFKDYTNLKDYVNTIKHHYGEKQNLILFDNNILASNEFKRIITDIKDLGFEKGAKLNNRQRIVDFNQGIDARLINNDNANDLSEICIKPIRIAFDDIRYEKVYKKAVMTVSNKELLNLSNYILYNYEDKPNDFYTRLKINVELNDQLGTKIYSFPMRYTPLNYTNRSYVGPHWNKRQIRGIQCILNVTKGIVGPKYDFFLEAFGNDLNEFNSIIIMPEEYIINRFKYKENRSRDWHKQYKSLTENQRSEFISAIADNNNETIEDAYIQTKSNKIKKLLSHYLYSRDVIKSNRGKDFEDYRFIEAI